MRVDPNELFGVSEFNIPETITKYLTYTLILHVVALAFAVASVLFGLLAHIGSLAVWCFPTCFASLASSFSLLALVFDLVIFYIAKSRIDAVSGASATIGVSVWLTLVAWIVAGVGGCAYGVGNCCMGRRQRRTSGDPNADAGYYKPSGPDDMRMQAIRDEQIRKKEQGLPSFQEYERTPLTSGGAEEEDKYMYEDAQSQPRGLNRDGSLVQGVGVGYGRRANRTPSNGQMRHRGQPDGYGNYSDLAPVPPAVSRRPSTTSGVSSAGNAGFGAGGGGVERAQPEGYGGYYGNAQHNCRSLLSILILVVTFWARLRSRLLRPVPTATLRLFEPATRRIRSIQCPTFASGSALLPASIHYPHVRAYPGTTQRLTGI